MVRRRLRGLTAIAGLVAVVLAPRALEAHPLHTSLTTVSFEAPTHMLGLSVRVFAEDFLAAAGARTADAPAVAAYVASHVTIAGADGRAIAFASCGTRRVGELLWLCLRTTIDPRTMPALRVRSVLLCEKFADQINLVQAEYGGRRTSVLFTRGDRPKALFG